VGQWKLFCDDHRLQPLGAIFVLVFTICAGVASIYSAWFGKPANTLASRPRVHIQKFELLRQKDTNAAGVSVFFKIEKSAVSKLRSIYRIAVTDFPGDIKNRQLEDSLFNGMLSKDKGGGDLGSDHADAERYVTITSDPIPNDVLQRIKDGSVAVYFMGRIEYKDQENKPLHTDYCAFYRGDPPPIFMCHDHNDEP
jgi:hypothetical protein